MKTTYIVAGAICIIAAAWTTIHMIQNKPKPETEQNQSSQTANDQPTDSILPVQNDDKPVDSTMPTPDLNKPAGSPSPYGFSQSKIENITAVFNTMDTQPMLGYFAEKVALVYDKTEPATFVTRNQAPKALEYFSDAKKPWNFFLSQADIDAYKNKSEVAKYFAANCLVGRSANGTHVVSLCTNESGKIDTIFLRR